MKVVAVNGSPRKNGNTQTVLEVMGKELEAQGVEFEILPVGNKPILGCIACNGCANSKDNYCVFGNDPVNEYSKKMREADGLILASPTYYGGMSGSVKCLLDRIFYSSSDYFRHKAGTAVTVVRRTGGLDALHGLNNYLRLSEVFTPPSQYWTVVHGREPGQALQDAEGVQTAKRNAQHLAYLIKVLEAGQDIPKPDDGEDRARTHFIR